MKKSSKLTDLSFSALFAAVIIICSWITVPAPVPFSLQTLGVFAATAFLGAGPALGSVVTYIVLGLIGLPVFTGFQGGVGVLLGPTGGYIFGFLLIPAVYALCRRLFSKKYTAPYLLAGLILCYTSGTAWYMLWSGARSLTAVLAVTVLPFVLPDILKLLLAAELAKRLKKAASGLIPGKDTSELSPSVIRKTLDRQVQVEVFGEIDSTNSAAARRIEEGADLPLLLLAERQTAGRGRRGRSFYSEGGLYMTLAVPAYPGFDVVGITSIAAVAVSVAIEELAGIRTGIKWVNDIYLDGKKICGILCETVNDKNSGKLSAVIIGIGVNLNLKELPEELRDIAGSLSCRDLSKNRLAAGIVNRLFALLDSREWLEEYKARSLALGKDIKYEKNGETFYAHAVGISPDGGLEVRLADGSTETLQSGEITLRIQ